jgi:catechol 2,3-dioxygenase-like lactoylglutathione lyase family enzyme
MIKIKSVAHITVQVTDVERARRLYRDVFGLVEMPRPNFNFPGGWFQCGDCQLHIVGQDKPDPPSGRHFAVVVESLAEARKAAEAAGLKCSEVTSVPGADRFFLTDPDNNRWELIEHTGEYRPDYRPTM